MLYVYNNINNIVPFKNQVNSREVYIIKFCDIINKNTTNEKYKLVKRHVKQ